MNWDQLIWYGASAAVCWIAGAALAFRSRKVWPAVTLSLCGSVVFMTFIAGLWVALERPPMRTMGETRLWYSFFLSLAGVAVYARWRYRWILSFSTLMSVVFICINIFKPEIHNKSLMPALQSVWFVPHVIVYMFAYALMGAVALFAVYLWLRSSRREPSDEEMGLCDNLVRIGWAFLSLGMAMERCGPRRRGAITGRGTPRRRGPRPRGSDICSICIFGRSGVTTIIGLSR